MGVLDFLFQGSAQPSKADSVTGIPQFMSDYTLGLLNKQNAIAAQGYVPYAPVTGTDANGQNTYGNGYQRLADFTPNQQEAYDLTNKSVGMYTPSIATALDIAGQSTTANAFNAAQPLLASATGINPLEAAQPAYNAAGEINAQLSAAPYLSQATDINPLESAQSSYDVAKNINASNMASPYFNTATGINPLGAATGVYNDAASLNGISAAQPYLQGANQTFTGDNVSAYMNPYNQNVMEALARQGQQNLQENLLPSVEQNFIRSGQYGSAGQQQAVGRALRDTQQSILDKQAQLLNQGYTQAGQQFNADAARQAQLAQTAGGLTAQQMQNLTNLGTAAGQLGVSEQGALGNLGQAQANIANAQMQNLANIGTAQGQLGVSEQGALGNLGQTSGNLANAQMANLTNLGTQAGGLGVQEQGALGNIGQVAGNMASQSARDQLSAAGQLGSLATSGQAVNLKDLAALESVGQTQQAQNQKALDVAYQDFLDQRNYPQQQIANLNAAIRGLPMTTTTNTSSSGNTYSASPLSQLAGSVSLANALSGVKTAAHGGHIKARNKNRRSTRGSGR